MRIGFVGTGRIAEAMVTGLCGGPTPPEQVLLSPRTAAIAERLAAAFAPARVAASNEEVVADSDVVVLAVRPDDTEQVVRKLTFRPDQRVVSVIALMPLQRIGELVRPAAVVRALPLPTTALRDGPLVLCPDEPWARTVLNPLGTVFGVDDEQSLDALWVPTALIAPHLQELATVADWVIRQGVPSTVADAFVRSMFAGLSTWARASDEDLDALCAESQTPGGLNEQALAQLRDAGQYRNLDAALDAVLARLRSAG